jgi:hypothetical protein
MRNLTPIEYAARCDERAVERRTSDFDNYVNWPERKRRWCFLNPVHRAPPSEDGA